MSDRECAAVERWVSEVHPGARLCARELLQYFDELPSPLDRIVGERLTPQERAAQPRIRERRRRYVESGTADDLDIDTQRRKHSAIWDRVVGIPRNDDEEEEEDEEEEDEEKEEEEPVERPPDVGAAPSENAGHPRSLLHTDGPAGALHRRYLAEIDGNALDGYYAPELLTEFGRVVRDRFIHGELDASYACDYDEHWDAQETNESWFDE